MKVKMIAVVAALAGVVFAHAAGFDGKALTTNDWFDASFTAGTVDTVIAQGTATGITLGAGSWTAVPVTGTAKIASDADAGGEATLLSIEAPGEELTFTPVALSETNGMETLVVNFKAEAVDSLTPPEGGAQGAFAIYSADGTAHSLAAYVSDGSSGVWTNLVYANAADLTNVWVVLTMDFATVDSVRYVRYSITPPAGSLTVLADSEGTEWFRSANASAKVVDSVSFSGIGSVRTFSGDSLDEAVVNVASYNNVSYATVADAIAAGVSDSWANGNVTLLANASWTPSGAGTYLIDVGVYVLTIDEGANYTVDGTSYVVSGFKYWWQSNVASNGVYYFLTAGNWKKANGETLTVADNGTGYPGSGDLAIIDTASTIYINGDIASDIAALATASLINWSSTDRTISGGIDVGEDVTLTLQSQNAKKIIASGRLSGSGTLYCKAISKDYSGVDMSGDTSAFVGTVNFYVDGGSRYCRIIDAKAANNANSTWNISTVDGSKVTDYTRGANYTALKVENSTFTFGALNAQFFSTESSKRANIVIGGKNKDSSLKGRFDTNNNNYTNSVYWVDPSSTLTFGMTNAYILAVTGGGAVTVADSGSVPASFGSHTQGGIYLNGDGGYLTMTEDDVLNASIASAVKAVDAGAVFGITNSAPVELDLSGKSALLLGKKFGKKGDGDLTVTGISTHGDVSVAGGSLATAATTLGGVTLAADTVLSVSAGTTIASLDSASGAKLAVDVTSLVESNDAQDVVTVTGGADLTDIVTLATNDTCYAYSFSGLETGNVKVTVSRKPEVFVWQGGSGSSWATPANWTLGGATATIVPGAVDTAQFDTAASISLAGNYDISNIVIKADVTISGGSTRYLKGISELQSVTPDGASRAPRIILDNAGLQSRDIYDNPVTWLADVEVVGTCELRAYTANTGSNPSSIRYNGNLHGSGSLKCWASGGSNRRSGVVLGGDNGDFNGSIEIQSGNIGSPGSTRTAPFFGAVTAGSSNAVWTITGNDNVKDSLTDMRALKGTESAPNKLYFGALNGAWRVFTNDSKGDYYDHYIEFVIGGANQDCTFNPLFSRANNAERCDSKVSIRKVGNGKLTIVGESDMTSVYAYYVDGGTLEFTYNHCLTSYSSNTPGPLAFGGGTLAFANSYTNNLASAEADPDESIKDVSSYVKNSTGPISVCFAEGQTSTWATALAASNTGGLVKKGAGTLTLSQKPLYTGDTYLDGGTLKIVDTWDGKVRTHEKGKSVYVDTTSTPGYKTFTLGHRRSVMIIVQ